MNNKKFTTLLRGIKISKRSSRLETIGSVDELNSFLGYFLSLYGKRIQSKRIPISDIITQIQKDLFVIGAELANYNGKSICSCHHYHYPNTECHPAGVIPNITKEQINALESRIDRLVRGLPIIHSFVLPQGVPEATMLHVMRTLCRKAERRVVNLSSHSKINPNMIGYLNRLSDLLFTLSRVVNKKYRQKEILWSH